MNVRVCACVCVAPPGPLPVLTETLGLLGACSMAGDLVCTAAGMCLQGVRRHQPTTLAGRQKAALIPSRQASKQASKQK